MLLCVCRLNNSLSTCFGMQGVFMWLCLCLCAYVCVFVQVYVVVCVQAQQLPEYVFRHAVCVYVVVFVFLCLYVCVCAGLCDCVRASLTTP